MHPFYRNNSFVTDERMGRVRISFHVSLGRVLKILVNKAFCAKVGTTSTAVDVYFGQLFSTGKSFCSKKL